MKQLWTTLADRRRAGPPAFRRKYSQMPNATLSFSLGGRLFVRGFWQSRRGKGPSPSLVPVPVHMLPVLYTFRRDLKKFPYDFPETGHACIYRQMIRIDSR